MKKPDVWIADESWVASVCCPEGLLKSERSSSTSGAQGMLVYEGRGGSVDSIFERGVVREENRRDIFKCK